MSNLSRITSGLLVAAILISAPQAVFADHFTREDVYKCSNQGRNAGAGAIIGGILGAALGGRNHAVEGAIAGAAAGGLTGLALSCHDEQTYIRNVDDCLDNPRQVEWDGGQVYVARSFNRYDGVVCREYISRVYTPNGTIQKDEYACQERGMWVHGYAYAEIYQAPAPVMVPPPAYPYGYYRPAPDYRDRRDERYDRDYYERRREERAHRERCDRERAYGYPIDRDCF